MLSAFWIIGFPALIIADRTLTTGFFPSGIRFEDGDFVIAYLSTFSLLLWADFRMRRPRRGAEAVLSEEDRTRLRNITSAYNTLGRHVDDRIDQQNTALRAMAAQVASQTGNINRGIERQKEIEGDFKLAAANAVAAFELWTGTVPELPSSRHAFSKAMLRLRQEVTRHE